MSFMKSCHCLEFKYGLSFKEIFANIANIASGRKHDDK